MLIHEIVIENFRGYEGRHRISAERLTALVGRNDSGKSTILDSLGAFFDHPLCKIDFEDVNKASLPKGELRIGLVFRDFPSELILDSSSKTSLEAEHLLNAAGFLEIHKIWSFTDSKLTSKPSVKICAVHPRAENVGDLLQLKISDLRKRLPADAAANKASCASLRAAIWTAADNLDLGDVEVPVDKEDAKEIWSRISDVLPHFALFRADRASTDDDAEVQDPLKIAISNAIASVLNICAFGVHLSRVWGPVGRARSSGLGCR
jgi:putative ATP-dependent endonuclease of OLD family